MKRLPIASPKSVADGIKVPARKQLARPPLTEEQVRLEEAIVEFEVECDRALEGNSEVGFDEK